MLQPPRISRIRPGVIVPSSNTVSEPLTQAIVTSIVDPTLDITVHFSRFRVTKIVLSKNSYSQFTLELMLSAADLLAEAQVDVIS
jgi:maleate isomerase